MEPVYQFLATYKWTILIGLFLFIFCLLIINFGFWISILVVFITALGVVIGYLLDFKIDLRKLLK